MDPQANIREQRATDAFNQMRGQIALDTDRKD